MQETRTTMSGLESKSQKYFGLRQTDNDDGDDEMIRLFVAQFTVSDEL